MALKKELLKATRVLADRGNNRAAGGSFSVQVVSSLRAPDRLFPRRRRSLVNTRTFYKVLCLVQSFDEGHVHCIELFATRPRSGFRYMPPERVADNLFGEPHRRDQFLQVHPGGDSHFFEHVNQVLGRRQAGRTAIAAEWAATHTADGRL